MGSEAVLAAWGIDIRGGRHLLGLLPGLKASADAVLDLLCDLKSRGMPDALQALMQPL
jgi:transposase-like protein